jgi:hypothetical protein
MSALLVGCGSPAGEQVDAYRELSSSLPVDDVGLSG